MANVFKFFDDLKHGKINNQIRSIKNSNIFKIKLIKFQISFRTF